MFQKHLQLYKSYERLLLYYCLIYNANMDILSLRILLRNFDDITVNNPDIPNWKTIFFIVLKDCSDHLYDPVNVSVNEPELDKPLS